jgi:hypothetical protein
MMLGYDVYDCFTMEHFRLRQRMTLKTKIYCSRLYIEVDFGTQRFFVMKHSCSLNNEENITFFGVEYSLSF